MDLEAGAVRLESGETKNRQPRMMRCSPELVILRAQRAEAERKRPGEPPDDRPAFLRRKRRPVGTFYKA